MPKKNSEMQGLGPAALPSAIRKAKLEAGRLRSLPAPWRKENPSVPESYWQTVSEDIEVRRATIVERLRIIESILRQEGRL